MPSVQIQGITANFDVIEDKTLSEGRFMTAEEVSRSAAICVIGSDVAEKYFPDRFARWTDRQGTRHSA